MEGLISLYAFIDLEGKEDDIIKEITEEQETQDFLINLLQDQLFTTGEDGNGVSLGDYSPVTIEIKKRKGQPTDRITLKDTGEFYKSYFIVAYVGGFVVDADDLKDDGTSKTRLFNQYGDDVLKPNIETIQLINEYYVEKIIEYIAFFFL